MVGALGAAGAAAALGTDGLVKSASAQLLQSGIRDDSILAKVKKEGVLRIGFSQSPPLFYIDPKTGQMTGGYKDLCDLLCKEMEVKPAYQEETWANSTVSLRAGKYDLFGSSLTAITSRMMTIDYVGPLWSKGYLFMVHKDNAGRFKRASDLNREDVVISVGAGTSEAQRVPVLFPKAKLITISGGSLLAVEPVRAKRAHAFGAADIDVIFSHNKNKDWAVLIDPNNPIERRWTTWAIRYGDPEWKSFLTTWIQNQVLMGEVKRLYDFYVEQTIRG
jgi:ABC-type amino acid transport substrate-binding protein